MKKTLVCGHGAVGRKVAEVLMEAKAEFTVVAKNLGGFSHLPYTFITGNPANEEVLRSAGITEADTVVVCTESDATNSFIVLLARGLNPELTILAIVKRPGSIEKLYKAGADQVVAESVIGAQIIAKHAISQHIGEFIDKITLTKNIEITELQIATSSKLAGVQIRNSGIREKSGGTIVAVKRGENLLVNPGANTKLEAGDKMIVMGNDDQIKTLSAMAKRVVKKVKNK